MINDFSGLGGEMFVLDDGWFGKKYSRDSDRSSLGDWEVSPGKLPDGLQALIDSCKCASIRFGIWIEPEMTNTISELYEQHPDWVISQPNRPLKKGRGRQSACTGSVQSQSTGLHFRSSRQVNDTVSGDCLH